MAQGSADKAEHHAGLVLYRLSPTTGAAEVLLFNDAHDPLPADSLTLNPRIAHAATLDTGEGKSRSGLWRHGGIYLPVRRPPDSCARRQVGELTGLAPKDYMVEDDFRVEIKYLADTRPKRVVYLLAHVSDQARIVPAGEGISFAWLPVQSALDKSMFRSMHDVLRKAFEYIEKVRAARVPPPGAILGTGGSHHFRTPHELDQRFLRSMNLGSLEGQFSRHPSPTHSPGQQQWGERPGDEERYSPGPRVGGSEPPSGTAESTLYKTRLCERFENEGHCSFSSKCSFAHGLYELRERPLHHSRNGGPSQAGPASENRLFKTKLCDRFAREGTCGYGSACNFAHGEAELRERPSPPFGRTHSRDGEDGDSATWASSLPRPGGERKSRPPSEECQLRPESPGLLVMKHHPGTYAFKMRLNSEKDQTVAATTSAAGPVESGSGVRRSPARPTEADSQLANHADGSYRQATPGSTRGDVDAGSGTKGLTSAAASNMRSSGRGDARKNVSLKELLSQEKTEQDRAWVQVVEYFGDEQEKVSRPPPKVQQRKPPSKEEQLAAELKEFMTGSLATLQSAGPGPEQQKLFAAEIKARETADSDGMCLCSTEVTRIEFRNDLSKPQLFNVLVPSLCDAPESFAKNLKLRMQLMKTVSVFQAICEQLSALLSLALHGEGVSTYSLYFIASSPCTSLPRRYQFVRSTADQTAWINAWERWLAKNPVFLPRSAAVFKFFYDVELVEEDAFLMWHAGPVAAGGSAEVREKVRPFIEWLQSAEEED
ncbi:MAG: hypothetical protein BJ554DRAFT_4349 [Olpidium bornovanus]|uniref:Uncharacterized protein n=1 Tax=Olpidium bornovanus TaxID=278681 RepID=A0A8H8DET3_9FUNG|nr:MAG: hypothetical protein BJ554DRAFT_4349 [Olpidium bornovanus]